MNAARGARKGTWLIGRMRRMRRAAARSLVAIPLALMAPAAGAAWAACTATVGIADGLQRIPGQVIAVPIQVTDLTGLGVIAADLTLVFDPLVLGVDANPVTAGTLTAGCTLTTNATAPGRLGISIYCVGELAGAGSLAQVDFHVLGGYGAGTPIAIVSAALNEGTPEVCADPGSFQVCGPEICDGIDNDCDTVADNGFDVGAACTAGQGVCAVAGARVCDAAGTGTVCDAVAGPPTGADADCNGLDEDCDGTADDHFAPLSIVCAPPACGQTGTRACSGGVIVDSCAAGAGLSLPAGVTGAAGRTVTVPISLSDVSGLGVLSADVAIQYDAAILAATAVAPGTLTSAPGCVVTPNLTVGGRVGVSAYCTTPMTGGGSLAALTFRILPAGGRSALSVAFAQLNEGTPPVCASGGSVESCMAEVCGNGLDDDCDGTVDEAGPRYVAATGGADGANDCLDSQIPCATMNHAIEEACAGETVSVAPGTYVENVVAGKPVRLAGPDPVTTVVYPAVSAPNPCAGSSLCGGLASNLVLVQADDVEITGLTLDGDNPALTSGLVRGGADLDARNGIITNHALGVYHRTRVHDVVVRNVYLRGIYMSSGGYDFALENNRVDNVQGEASSVAMFAFGGTGTMSGNVVSNANDAISANWSEGIRFADNVVTASGSGVHTDNAGVDPNRPDVLEGNRVTDCATNGYGVWVFVPYVGPVVRNNEVSGCAVGLAAAGQGRAVTTLFEGNVVDGLGAPNTAGVYVTTDEFGFGYADVSAEFRGNTVRNATDGFYLEETPGEPGHMTVVATGNVITGHQTGVDLAVNEAGGLVSFTGNDISGNSQYGASNADPAAETLQASCNWWGAPGGPAHAGNPAGSGDAVTDGVAYAGWSTARDFNVDTDGDGYTSCQGDCQVADAAVSPAAPDAVCDGLDQNCNGTPDDGYVPDASCFLPGACAAGNAASACVAGVETACRTGAPGAQVLVQMGSPMKYVANLAGDPDVELVGSGSPISYLANSGDPGIPGAAWTAVSFDDASWLPGRYGVGYETEPPGATDLIQSAVDAGTLSVYTRARFTIGDVGGIRALLLGADYDDGFVAWVNGVEVARSASMPGGEPAWDTAAESHESSNGAAPVYGALLDITAAALPVLHDGDNVLAVGVWNLGPGGSTDLVLAPRLSMVPDWAREPFDDSTWTAGSYGVGYESEPPGASALLGTVVPEGALSVYTRTVFPVGSAAAVTRLKLGVDYDDGYVAWINGVEVLAAGTMPMGGLAFNTNPAPHPSSHGSVPDYGALQDISQRGIPALHDGDNVLAIGVWNHRAGAVSSDLVLVPRLSIEDGELCDGLDNDCNGQVDEGFGNADGDSMADCVDPDDDNDGVPDAADCAPADPAASAGPVAEVADMTFARSAYRAPVLMWADQGSGVLYDVAGGDVLSLAPDGGVSGAVCAADDLAQAVFDDPRPAPPPGHAWYYLVRAEKSGCGASGYGRDSAGNERLPGADCP